MNSYNGFCILLTWVKVEIQLLVVISLRTWSPRKKRRGANWNEANKEIRPCSWDKNIIENDSYIYSPFDNSENDKDYLPSSNNASESERGYFDEEKKEKVRFMNVNI